MRNPRYMKRLQSEIDQFCTSQTNKGPITYAQALTLPFLQAVILEATRLHPSIIYQLPRHSPEEGITIDGKVIPSGIDIGISPLTMNRDKAIFGEDAESFRPERWMEDKEKARVMESRLSTVRTERAISDVSSGLGLGLALEGTLRFLKSISSWRSF
jgi:cytochrome P450